MDALSRRVTPMLRIQVVGKRHMATPCPSGTATAESAGVASGFLIVLTLAYSHLSPSSLPPLLLALVLLRGGRGARPLRWVPTGFWARTANGFSCIIAAAESRAPVLVRPPPTVI